MEKSNLQSLTERILPKKDVSEKKENIFTEEEKKMLRAQSWTLEFLCNILQKKVPDGIFICVEGEFYMERSIEEFMKTIKLDEVYFNEEHHSEVPPNDLWVFGLTFLQNPSRNLEVYIFHEGLANTLREHVKH